MKTKIFILAALVLCIDAATEAQTASGLPQWYIDSIGQVPAPNLDSAVKPAVTRDSTSLAAVDSTADSASTSLIAIDSSKISTTEDSASHEKVAEGVSINQRYGMWGYLVPFLIILVSGIVMMRKRGWLNFQRRSRIERLNEKLKAVEKEEEIKTKRSNSQVDRKKYAMEELGKAAGVVVEQNGASKPKWKTHKDVRKFISFLLEGKWFLHWNPMRGFVISLSILGVVLAGFLVGCMMRTKPAPERGMVVNPEPQPAITPTVTVMEEDDEDVIEVDPHISQPEEVHGPAVRLGGPDEGYVDAPTGRYGKTVVEATGYIYYYYPEDKVFGLKEPNNTNCSNAPFKDEPGLDRPRTYLGSVAWSSRCGYDTRVKWKRVWSPLSI